MKGKSPFDDYKWKKKIKTKNTGGGLYIRTKWLEYNFYIFVLVHAFSEDNILWDSSGFVDSYNSHSKFRYIETIVWSKHVLFISTSIPLLHKV